MCLLIPFPYTNISFFIELGFLDGRSFSFSSSVCFTHSFSLHLSADQHWSWHYACCNGGALSEDQRFEILEDDKFLDQDFRSYFRPRCCNRACTNVCFWYELGSVFPFCRRRIWKRPCSGRSVCFFLRIGIFRNSSFWMGPRGT